MRPFPKGRTFRDPFAVGSALEHVRAESRGTSRDAIDDMCGGPPACFNVSALAVAEGVDRRPPQRLARRSVPRACSQALRLVRPH